MSNQFTYNNGYQDFRGYNYPNQDFYQNYHWAMRAGFQVNDRVRIGENAVDLTTGQPIPSVWHGYEDTISAVRNDGAEVLLQALNVWVRASDVRLLGPGRASVVNGTWALTAAEEAANVSPTEPRVLEPGTVVGVRLIQPTDGSRFVRWESDVPNVQFIPNATTENVLFVMPDSNITVRAVLNALQPPTPPIGTTPPMRAVNVAGGVGSGFFPEGTTVQIVATPPEGDQFVNWTILSGGITLADINRAHTSFTLGNQDVSIRANFEAIPATPPPPPPPPIPEPPTPEPFRVGDLVTVNSGVQTWATGEGMPNWVHGRTYPIIEIRTRNGVLELLLGNGINSWIRATDVTRASETTSPPVRVGDTVRVNQGTRIWATGEGMPNWIHGRTYPVIEIRTRSGVTELLLGNGINSWIRQPDVTRVSGTANSPIQINNRVRVNTGVGTWATGERMPAWVHGRVYPVIEIRTRSGVTELLLGDINSWIRQVDVTRV